jgi:hypothetical protein
VNGANGALNAEVSSGSDGDTLTTEEDAGAGSVGASAANNVPLI